MVYIHLIFIFKIIIGNLNVVPSEYQRNEIGSTFLRNKIQNVPWRSYVLFRALSKDAIKSKEAIENKVTLDYVLPYVEDCIWLRRRQNLIMLSCLSLDPRDRPPISHILSLLALPSPSHSLYLARPHHSRTCLTLILLARPAITIPFFCMHFPSYPACITGASLPGSPSYQPNTNFLFLNPCSRPLFAPLRYAA